MTHEEMYAASPIFIGGRYKFDYPVEFTSFDDYSAHRGQNVVVIRPCTADEADVLWDDPDDTGTPIIVDRMFKVQADDGWIGDAWEGELLSGGFAECE